MKKIVSPRDIVKSGLCIGCGLCVAQSQRNDARMNFDVFGQLKPVGPSEWFNKSSVSFSEICPFSPAAENENQLAEAAFPSAEQKNNFIGRYEANYVGHVLEDNYRMLGSSGGMVTWIATELMRKGLIDGVAHVVATMNPKKEQRYFKYRISRSEEEISEGAKSRYYPVELSDILKTIQDVPGRYAVIAVPCMIKGLQLLRRKDPLYRERIRFTLGLFCGHMKSARFAESFAWQMKVPVHKVKQVEFRHKFPDRPANWYNARLTLEDGSNVHRDWWQMVDGDWGAGFFMNAACNFCDDVVAETADISFGDAWIQPYASDGKGTNVVIIRSQLINSIVQNGINQGRLKFQEVDAGFVKQTQAAGFRQRREGLSYRLTWATRHLQPEKRVLPTDRLSRERKIIYRMRFLISRWSHRIFRIARVLHWPAVYIFWARTVAAVYYGVCYHNASWKSIKKRFREFKEG